MFLMSAGVLDLDTMVSKSEAVTFTNKIKILKTLLQKKNLIVQSRQLSKKKGLVFK